MLETVMPNFILTRDDFEKLGRVEEWDRYEDDNERTMRFFVDGVRLTFDELSQIGHKMDYKDILFENKRRKKRDIHKQLTPELELEYNQRNYVVYYPPEKCVEDAINGFCNNLSELIDRHAEVDEFVDITAYESVIKLAKNTSYAIEQKPQLVGDLFYILFSFRDELAKHKPEEDIGKIPIPGQMFANIIFVYEQAINAYTDKVMEIIKKLREDKADADKTIEYLKKNKDGILFAIYNVKRELESDHQGELTQSMAWRLAQAVLNGEMDFAEYLADTTNEVLVSISTNYGRKSKELDEEEEKVREKFYKSLNKEPPSKGDKRLLCFRTFKTYLDFSKKPPSNDAEKKARKKWFFFEIPELDNSPSNFVKLLKERLNRKNRNKRRKL